MAALKLSDEFLVLAALAKKNGRHSEAGKKLLILSSYAWRVAPAVARVRDTQVARAETH